MNSVKLGDVTVKIGSGATPRGGKNVYVAEGTALIRSQNVLDLGITLEGLAFIDDHAAEKLSGVSVQQDDVLINITGDSTARVALWNMELPARVNQHVAIVRSDRERLDPRWLQYWLAQPRVKDNLLLLASAGGSRPALTKTMLSDIEIPLPALATQHKVASVLGSLDDKIAANRATSSASRQLIQAIAENSENRVSLGKLAARSKTSVRPSRLGRHLVAHYSIPNFDTGYPALESTATIRSNKMLIEHACVLVSKLNPDTPRIWSIPAVSEKQVSLGSPEFIVLEPSGVTQSQLYAATLHPNFHEQLASLVGGTSKSHQRVKPEEMLKCLVPDVRELTNAQIDFLETLVQLDAHAVQETNSLTNTRDELLPLLMSGKISVKEAEQQATAAGADSTSEESEA